MSKEKSLQDLDIKIGDSFFVVDTYVHSSKPDVFFAEMREWIVTNIQNRKHKSYFTGRSCAGATRYYYLTCCLDGCSGSYDEKGNFTFHPKVPAKFKKKIKSTAPPPLGFFRSTIDAYQYYVDDQKTDITYAEEEANSAIKLADKHYWENEIKTSRTLLRSATIKLNKLKKEREILREKRRQARAKNQISG